ncbi:MAG: TIR domain-containing protein [Patescibacteria group bacterium]
MVIAEEKGNNYEYDVVFSLAGEQREYVEEVATVLQDSGIKVWFYRFKELELWGKNQIDAFAEIFTKRARYCVIFISKEYTEKIWPNLERQFIQSRWLTDPDYLLPARFDNSLVIGIPDTIAYINLEGKTSDRFAEQLIQKISNKTVKEAVKKPHFRTPKVKQDFDPIDIRNEWIFYIVEELENRVSKIKGMKLSHDEIEGVMHTRVLLNNNIVYSLNIYKKAFFAGDNGISFCGTPGLYHSISGTNATGEFIWSKEKECVALKLLDLSLLESPAGGEKLLSKDEFIEALWNRICDETERIC